MEGTLTVCGLNELESGLRSAGLLLRPLFQAKSNLLRIR